jgi:hypothetical protein
MLPPPLGPPVPPGAVLCEGVMLDGAVVLVDDVVGVVVLLGALLPPPPQPTVKTSMAAPPKTAKAVLASDLIGFPLSCQSVSPRTPTCGRANGFDPCSHFAPPRITAEAGEKP